jgi:hypothetical protein
MSVDDTTLESFQKNGECIPLLLTNVVQKVTNQQTIFLSNLNLLQLHVGCFWTYSPFAPSCLFVANLCVTLYCSAKLQPERLIAWLCLCLSETKSWFVDSLEEWRKKKDLDNLTICSEGSFPTSRTRGCKCYPWRILVFLLSLTSMFTSLIL